MSDGESEPGETNLEQSTPPPPGADEPSGQPTAGTVAGTRLERRRRRRRLAVEWLAVLLVALLLAVGIRTFVVQAFYIPSASMQPTLDIGDRILVQKAFFDYHSLKRGDIIVFHQPPTDTCPPPETDLVKRVIGLGGQTIYNIGNNIYIDGKRISEPYLPKNDPLGTNIPQGTPEHPYKIPKDDFYVLGDNRNISCDSRFWGPVPGKTIVGKVIVLWWHNSHPYLRFF